jgi:hypothetical protein
MHAAWHSYNKTLTLRVQIYKYEAQMLRLLQYDVGQLANPLRVSLYVLSVEHIVSFYALTTACFSIRTVPESTGCIGSQPHR